MILFLKEKRREEPDVLGKIEADLKRSRAVSNAISWSPYKEKSTPSMTSAVTEM